LGLCTSQGDISVKAIKAVAGSEDYQARIDEIEDKLRDYLENPRLVQSAEALEKLEQEIRALTEELAALVSGRQIQHALDSEELKEAQNKLITQWPHRLQNHDSEGVWVRTAGGYEIWVKARYFRRKGNRSGKRRYRGFYLGLLLLGITERCTPGFAAEVSLLAAMLGSLAEARDVLAERGLRIDIKVLRRITYRFSQRARLTQRLQGLGFDETVAGRRVVVSMDGGRIRLRERKRGRKTPKGRSRYKGAWREPKLFIIYVVDADGKMERSFMPIMDANIRGPDTLFKLLGNYLGQLGISEAERVLFVADGARWIWNRIAALVHRLGLKPGQVYELIDFYHAVEHLGKVASLRKSWTPKQRKIWVRKHRRLLGQGRVEAVIDAVKEICRGRNSKGIRTERDYFVRNISRMAYARIRALGLPIGSGSVESAIRRVVNLRLKGPCIFWCKENAEAILLLRCYWKAGRWNQLKNQANLLVPEAYA
jgi:hypothetical protein